MSSKILTKLQNNEVIEKKPDSNASTTPSRSILAWFKNISEVMDADGKGK
jgi:hypothetical protein